MVYNSAVILIPARLNSSRFPRKILEDIDGKPLIIHVLERAKLLNLCECYVACCSNEIKEVVEKFGGRAILTDPDLPSGTDRIFAALKTFEKKPEYIINLQGDNPVFDANILPKLLQVLKSNEKIDMTTSVKLNLNLEDLNNENVVKVVFNNMDINLPGRALYFSRAPIPYGSVNFYSHIGIYAYRYSAIEKFISLPQSYLEKTEKLEQLRCLQNNMNVWAVPVDGISLSVDVEDDLKVVMDYFKKFS